MLGTDKGKIIWGKSDMAELVADLAILTEFATDRLAEKYGQSNAEKVISKVLGESIADSHKKNSGKGALV